MFVPGQHGVLPAMHGVMPVPHGMMSGQHSAMLGGVSVLLKPPLMGRRPILPSLRDEQQFCLRWEQHLINQQAMFARLLERGSFCDVALVCEEKLINVHKLVLSSSSPYFELILTQFEKRDPAIVLKDIKYETMLALVHFMYRGEVCVDQSKLSEVLEAARALKVKGLSEEVTDNGIPRNPGVGMKRPAEVPAPHPAIKKTRRRGRPKKICTPPPPQIPVPVYKRRRRMGRPRKVQEPPEVQEKVIPEENVENSKEEPHREETPMKDKAPEQDVDIAPIVEACLAVRDAEAARDDSSAPIIQLEEYVKRGGTHSRYWSEPWVSRVMDAIKRKEMSLQDGANKLGIKYQSLYGRYRVHHGYLITRTSDKPQRSASLRSHNEDSDNSLSLDCERGICNDWDPSLNLEPLIQIDMDDDDQRQRDTRTKSDDAIEASPILGL